MNLYSVSPMLQDDYAKLVHVDETREFFHFQGNSANQWRPLTLKWHVKENGSKTSLIVNDIVHVFGAVMDMAVSQKAKDALSEILNNHTEFLPIKIVGEPDTWYLINVTNVVKNALNPEKSQFKVFKSGKRGPVTKAIFEDKNLPESEAFIYPESPENFMFKGELLKNTVKEACLKGFEFQKCRLDTELEEETS